jgi:hypothetical protein
VKAPLELTLRLAAPDDDVDVARLAILDSARPPSRPLLLAEVAGELWAAVSLTDLSVIADPFRPSGEIAAIAVQRARQLRSAQPTRTVRRTSVWRPLRTRSV